MAAKITGNGKRVRPLELELKRDRHFAEAVRLINSLMDPEERRRRFVADMAAALRALLELEVESFGREGRTWIHDTYQTATSIPK